MLDPVEVKDNNKFYPSVFIIKVSTMLLCRYNSHLINLSMLSYIDISGQLLLIAINKKIKDEIE